MFFSVFVILDNLSAMRISSFVLFQEARECIPECEMLLSGGCRSPRQFALLNLIFAAQLALMGNLHHKGGILEGKAVG